MSSNQTSHTSGVPGSAPKFAFFGGNSNWTKIGADQNYADFDSKILHVGSQFHRRSFWAIAQRHLAASGTCVTHQWSEFFRESISDDMWPSFITLSYQICSPRLTSSNSSAWWCKGFPDLTKCLPAGCWFMGITWNHTQLLGMACRLVDLWSHIGPNYSWWSAIPSVGLNPANWNSNDWNMFHLFQAMQTSYWCIEPWFHLASVASFLLSFTCYSHFCRFTWCVLPRATVEL